MRLNLGEAPEALRESSIPLRSVTGNLEAWRHYARGMACFERHSFAGTFEACLEDIRKASPRLPVLVLSMHPEAEFAMRALKAGAAGYVTKRSASDELVIAIRKVLQGGDERRATERERAKARLNG